MLIWLALVVRKPLESVDLWSVRGGGWIVTLYLVLPFTEPDIQDKVPEVLFFGTKDKLVTPLGGAKQGKECANRSSRKKYTLLVNAT